MYYFQNAASALPNVSNDTENQNSRNMKEKAPSLSGRSVFGVLTNKVNNGQRTIRPNICDCLKKYHDHPNRRRRKISPETSSKKSSSSIASSGPNGRAINPKCRKEDNYAPQLHRPISNPKNYPSTHVTPTNNHEAKLAKPQSVVAFDVVRAAFTKHIDFEDFLNECQFADFSFSGMATSPVARMMEATDYLIGIMAYEQSRETKARFQLKDFIARGSQPSITEDMITTLADWMVEVQENFSFNHETIHLAWGLLYSYLYHSQRVQRREIQLMACAAIMVACKHEERQMPLMSEFLYITDNAYTKEDFLEAECRLLVIIDFNVHRPNPYVFLRRYARVLDAHCPKVKFMASFLLEVGMHSHTINLSRESKKAAAVLWLARRVLSNPSYHNWLQRPETQVMRRQVRLDNRLQAIFTLNDVPTKKHRPVLARFQSSIEPLLFLPGDDANQSKPLNLTRKPLVESDTNTKEPTSEDESVDKIDQDLVDKVRRLRETDDQLCPFWPLILHHITGYEESELIPLALSYHKIAMRLLAEVVRGRNLELASSATASTAPLHPDLNPGQYPSCGSGTRGLQNQPSSFTAVDKERNTSSDGQHLRRQVVTKYWSPSFFSVADAYPQLSFENLIPDFPEIQCKDDCTCFVCENLINVGLPNVLF